MAETIGSDGRFKDRTGIASQGVVFNVSLGAATTAAAGYRKVPYDTKIFDPYNYFSTANSRFLPLIAGYYRLSGGAYLGTTPGEVGVLFYKNGVAIHNAADYVGLTGSPIINGSTLMYLNGSTDYIEVFVYTANSVVINAASSTNQYTSFQGELVGTSVGVVPEPWHYVGATGEPAFVNSWSNFGGGHATASFYKDPGSVVHLRGMLSSPASAGTTAFTLPVGYRPGMLELISLISNNATGRVQIGTDGTVTFQSPPTTASTWVTLNSVTFRAEQ